VAREVQGDRSEAGGQSGQDRIPLGVVESQAVNEDARRARGAAAALRATG